MARVDLTDFSGGVFEAVSPGDFSERQNAIVQGFVLEDEVRLRSQGPVQQVSALTDVVAVRAFRGTTNRYIVVIRSSGAVEWAVAPSRTALNATTSTLTFTAFSGITNNADFRFTTETRVQVSNEYRQALLVHSLSGSAQGLLIYENAGALTYQAITDFYPELSNRVALVTVTEGGSGYTSAPTVSFTGGGGSGATATATITGDAVTSVVVTDGGTGFTSTPTVAFSGGGGTDAAATAVIEEFQVSGKLPRHNVGAMWSDTLMLGDIEWSAANTTSLAAGNVQRYSNFVWHATDATDLTAFDPRFPARVAEEGAVVVGLQEVPEGMLVLTTTTTGQAGLVLLRGTADNYTLEVLRPGLGLPAETSTAQRTPLHTWWNEIASTVFVDSLGKIHQVRGTQVDRIDRFGVNPPEVGTAGEQAVGVGQWLFAVRDGRLLVLRSFGSDGAWTEIVGPAGVPSSLCALEDCLYFVSNNRLYRYCIEGPEAERGLVAGVAVDLTLGTRTLGNPEELLDKWWGGVSVRVQGVTNGVLKSVTVADRGALASSPGTAVFTLNQSLGPRDLVSVPGLGPSIECSATLVFTGDVRIENVSFDVEAGDDQR